MNKPSTENKLSMDDITPKSVINQAFVESRAVKYAQAKLFPHTAGSAFRLLSGKIREKRFTRNDDEPKERTFSVTPGGLTVFLTRPTYDYIVDEDARVFEFPAELAPVVFADHLAEYGCVCLNRGTVTVPPPAAEQPKRKATLQSFMGTVTAPAMPAAIKRRSPIPTPSASQPITQDEKPVLKRASLADLVAAVTPPVIKPTIPFGLTPAEFAALEDGNLEKHQIDIVDEAPRRSEHSILLPTGACSPDAKTLGRLDLTTRRHTKGYVPIRRGEED